MTSIVEPWEEYDASRRNTGLVIVTWLFGGLFLILAGYLTWFNVIKRDSIINNAYNTKEDAASDRIIRGDIVTTGGEQLAYTTVDYTGNEVRVYPYGRIFAHVIGYSTNGKSGLESSASSQLMQSHSSLMDKLKYDQDSEKAKGDTVEVTLEPRLQQAAWYALGDYRGAIVAIEPDSGRILAMVSKPDFDPGTIGETWETIISDDSDSSLLNRATSGLYPPGSTFKILTALAYIRSKNGNYQDFSYDCTGTLTEGDVTIGCYNGQVHGQEILATAFANSCNTAFASIGLELDDREFNNLAKSFCFNRPLPTSLPHSQSVFKLDRGSSYGEEMTTAIGQGETLVTPLHMAMITACVANAGTMMKPYLVSRVISADGSVVSETKPEIFDELMTVEEAAAIGSFMKETVISGTGAALSWNSYTVAGKTGSAEYITPTGETGTHSWFVGYSGADDPDVAVAIIAEDGGTGSSTAVPIAQQLFDAWYYG